jgi:hypothetical protein
VGRAEIPWDLWPWGLNWKGLLSPFTPASAEKEWTSARWGGMVVF